MLVEGDEWAHVEALDPDAGYWARRFAQLVNWRARGEKAVIEPSSLQRRNSSTAQGNRAAEGGGRAHRERVRGSQGETALGRSLGLRSWSDARNGRDPRAANATSVGACIPRKLIDGATDSILRIHALRPDRVHLAHHEQAWLPVWEPRNDPVHRRRARLRL